MNPSKPKLPLDSDRVLEEPSGIIMNNPDPELPTSSQNTNVPAPAGPSQPSESKKPRGASRRNTEDDSNGLVRYNPRGKLEHFDGRGKKWVPAVYHDDLRDVLIREASAKGSYVNARKKGEGVNDVTSFLPSQKSWGEERNAWPEILFQIDAVRDESLPKGFPLWYRNGKLVLDHENNPVRDISTIPETCSSEIEGWQLVAILHADHRIHLADIRARMPGTVVKGEKLVPLFGKNTLSMRMTHFRKKAGIWPRTERAGSKELKAVLQRTLPVECLAGNSTKAFNRLLTKAEIEMLNKVNKDKYPQKGRLENRTKGTGVSENTETFKKRKRNATQTPSISQDGKIPGATVKRACLQNTTEQSGAISRDTSSTSDFTIPIDYNSVAAVPSSNSWNSSKLSLVGTFSSKYVPSTSAVGDNVSGYWTANQPITEHDGAYSHGYGQPYDLSATAGYHEDRRANMSNSYAPGFDYPCPTNFELSGNRWPQSTQAEGKKLGSPYYPPTTNFGQSGSGGVEFPRIKGRTEVATPQYSFRSNFEQPGSGHLEYREAYGGSYGIASDGSLTIEPGQDDPVGLQHPPDSQPLVDRLTEAEPESCREEEVKLGPYGPLPRGYSLAWNPNLSSSEPSRQP